MTTEKIVLRYSRADKHTTTEDNVMDTSNVKNYKALTIRMHDANYLFYMHDGKPFEDLNEILLKGCTPNISEQE